MADRKIHFSLLDELIKSCYTASGFDLAGNSLYSRLCMCWSFLLLWLKGYFCVNFLPLPQIEKQMSCIMGLPGPAHNPSCSSPQVQSSQSLTLTSTSHFFGLVLYSILAIRLCFVERTKHYALWPHQRENLAQNQKCSLFHDVLFIYQDCFGVSFYR